MNIKNAATKGLQICILFPKFLELFVLCVGICWIQYRDEPTPIGTEITSSKL